MVGLIVLGSDKEVDADDDRRWIFELISRHLAHALTNARRYSTLRTEEELYRSSVESLPDVVYRLTPAGTISYLSPRVEELTGYRVDEFLQSPDFWRSLVHPDDRATYSLRVSGNADPRPGQEIFYRILPKGKAEYRRVRDAVHYLRGADGAVSSIVGLLLPLPLESGGPIAPALTVITEAGRDMAGASDAAAVLSMALHGMTMAVGGSRAAVYRTRSDQGVERMLSTPSGSDDSWTSPDLALAVEPLVLEAARGEGGVQGSVLSLPVIAVRVPLTQGLPIVLVVLGNADRAFPPAGLRLAENIATLTRLALDRVSSPHGSVPKDGHEVQDNKDLDDFAYVVSHDLKEPLITIEGYTKILREDFGSALPPEASAYLDTVTRAGERMKSLIEDLLTLSRVGRGHEGEGEVEVGRVVHDVLADMAFTLRARDAEVRVPDVLPTISYNRTHLGMVLRNLLANAVKFNRSERPLVVLDVRDRGREHLFSVRDNGIGIAPEHHERVFEVFRRLHPSEEFPGTGAGLTIARKIVEYHQGRIWVESALEQGSTFFFTIPKEKGRL